MNFSPHRHRLAWTLAVLSSLPLRAHAWSIPGHMLSGAIAYQILQRENPAGIAGVKKILEHHPWYETRWRSQLDAVPEANRDELLFMLAARWADDIRTLDPQQNRPPWHYINLPFKPDGQPTTINALAPQNTNVVTALIDNNRIVMTETNPGRKTTALTWLFHLVGDIASISAPWFT